MKQELHEAHLRMFATHVLRVLEREKEWNEDTIEEISFAAMDLGLAETDSSGLFKQKEVDRD
jgi:hypothetical protein